MSEIFEDLFGLQFCQYKCGTYIGFSDGKLSADGQSHKPLEATTGKIHECPKEGWSKEKQCIQCNGKIIFYNSCVVNGKKVRFDSPGVRHNCTQQSEDFVDNESIVDSNSSVQETQGRSNGCYYNEDTLENSK
jgi:hypothetical protein